VKIVAGDKLHAAVPLDISTTIINGRAKLTMVAVYSLRVHHARFVVVDPLVLFVTGRLLQESNGGIRWTRDHVISQKREGSRSLWFWKVPGRSLGGCRNWSGRSGPRNLDQIWTKSGPNLDTISTGFLKTGAEIPGKILCPRTYEGINFGFRFV
jgi:hypothetical protein